MNKLQCKDQRIGLTKSTKFRCRSVMTKYISKAMDMIDNLLIIITNCKKFILTF